MPTRKDIEALYLPTGRVITEEFYSKLVSVLHEFKDEIDEITSVISYGYVKSDLVPDLDLALNIGSQVYKFKEVWGGWGYFAYRLVVAGRDVTEVSPHALRHVYGGDDPIPSNDFLLRFQKHLGLWWFNNNWLPAGMLPNGVGGTGYIEWTEDSVRLHSGTTSGSWAWINKFATGLAGAGSWNKKRYFGALVYLPTHSAQIIKLFTGYIYHPSYTNDVFNHIGFKVIDNNLYGTVANNSYESTLLLETLTTDVYRRLECVLTPGVECRFYVDGVDKGAITTNLPTGSGYARYMLFASVYNTEAVDKRLYLFEVRIFQEE